MTAQELNEIMHSWQLNAAELAKILCLHTNKMSEYLGDVERIPCAIAFSIDALQRLSEQERKKVFIERLQRKTHGKI